MALGLVVVLAAGASACGGSSSPAAAPGTAPATNLPGNVVLASVQTTAAAKSARESMTISTGSGPMGFSMTTNGAVDFATGNSEFKSELGGPLASFLPGGLEMRVVGGVVYMKLPASIGGLFGGSGSGDQWLSLNTAAAAGGSSPFSNLGQSDPTQVLGALERVSDDVKEVGTATVRGVQTKHYTATIDFAKAIDNAKFPKALRGKAKGLFGNAGMKSLPVDVYLDSDGRLRRMTLDMDLSSFATGATGATGASGAVLPTISMTLDLYDFGTPVTVQAPPANEIVQLPKLGALGGMGGLGGLHLPTGAPALKTS